MIFARFMLDFCNRFSIEFRAIFGRFSVDFRFFSVIFCDFEKIAVFFEGVRKVALQRLRGNSKMPALSSFWEPAGSQKSTKIDPGGEKTRSGREPEAIFVDFPRRRRSESLWGPILARFFTENHV